MAESAETGANNIATLPDYSEEHEYCSVCNDDNVVLVIRGRSQTVVLCSKHAGQMLREAMALNLF